ncbi:MAG: isovaleryl-CoA dehydrogenase [Chloroflexi bacterium RBG_16_68_14]|nr:MAG: isovaleryl-CoA dehydrogenase [Chloroflexi bacterium RBG_16_68_14]
MTNDLLSDEHRILRDTVRAFARRELGPIADEIDRTDTFPPDLFRRLGELGVLGVTVPREYGGAGADLLSGVLIIEQLARVSGSVALSYGAHANLCVNTLCVNGTEEQRLAYLPGLCSGELVGALAITEPDAGSDAMSMKTTAVADGDDFVLSGTKTLITNGSIADVIVLYARMAGVTGARGVTPFIVERRLPGFSVSRTFDKFGHRGSPTAELRLDDCRVPRRNLLGKPNKGATILMRGLDIERVFLAGEPLGIAEEALALSIEYARQRHQFGQPIGNFQLIQAKLADMYTQIEAARALVYQTAVQADRGAVHKEAAAAILFTAEMATRVCLDAMQVHGGYGYLNDLPLGRLVRDAKLLEIGAGTSEIRRLIIGRELVK